MVCIACQNYDATQGTGENWMTTKKNVAEHTEYIAEMAGQLANMAESIDRPFLSTLLRMASLEATDLPALRDVHQAMKRDTSPRSGTPKPIAIGFFDWDILNDRVYADASFARACSVTPVKARDGAPLAHFIRKVHSDDREYLMQMITSAVEQRTPFNAEYRLVSSTRKTVRHVRATGQAIYDRRGRAVRLSGTVVDITAQWLQRAA